MEKVRLSEEVQFASPCNNQPDQEKTHLARANGSVIDLEAVTKLAQTHPDVFEWKTYINLAAKATEATTEPPAAPEPLPTKPQSSRRQPGDIQAAERWADSHLSPRAKRLAVHHEPVKLVRNHDGQWIEVPTHMDKIQERDQGHQGKEHEDERQSRFGAGKAYRTRTINKIKTTKAAGQAESGVVVPQPEELQHRRPYEPPVTVFTTDLNEPNFPPIPQETTNDTSVTPPEAVAPLELVDQDDFGPDIIDFGIARELVDAAPTVPEWQEAVQATALTILGESIRENDPEEEERHRRAEADARALADGDEEERFTERERHLFEKNDPDAVERWAKRHYSSQALKLANKRPDTKEKRGRDRGWHKVSTHWESRQDHHEGQQDWYNEDERRHKWGLPKVFREKLIEAREEAKAHQGSHVIHTEILNHKVYFPRAEKPAVEPQLPRRSKIRSSAVETPSAALETKPNTLPPDFKPTPRRSRWDEDENDRPMTACDAFGADSNRFGRPNEPHATRRPQ